MFVRRVFYPILVLTTSCQTYDFERVVPLAVAQTTDKTIVASKRLKPNVMLLVDNSGSMNYPTDRSNPNCVNAMNQVCGESSSLPCPTSCPTRISEMKNAMGSFFQQSPTLARFGVSKYPTDSQCSPATNIDVSLPVPSATDDGTDSSLTATSNQVNAFIQALLPTGGTPTGSSLSFIGTYGGINDASDFRDDFVLLLTDGLPNCNDANPNGLCACGGSCSAAQQQACACTLTSSCSNTFCSKGCLDRDGAVAAVKALKQKGIRTIVVGFGADLVGGDGPAVLNAMAKEGGFARECPNGTDAECGGQPGSCNATTKQCSTAFFQAANGTELAAALRKISEAFQGDPCVFQLSSRPSDPRYLSVVIDDQSVASSATTWSYDANSNKVTFVGDLCSRLKTSTTQNPVNVEFRIVERF
ncbi:MAG: adventurous gliding motility lipoprotein CglB [Myxococcota bacterium]